MIIYLDVDEVLADFTGAFVTLYNRRNGTNWTTDQITGWNFIPILQGNEKWWDYTETEKGFWRNLPLLPWAHEMVKLASESGYLWCFCTSLAICQPDILDDRRNWLHEHFREFDPKVSQRLIVAKRKELVVHEGDALIDDSVTNYDAVRAVGGTVFLLSQPWNEGHDSRWTPQQIIKWLRDIRKGG